MWCHFRSYWWPLKRTSSFITGCVGGDVGAGGSGGVGVGPGVDRWTDELVAFSLTK